MKIFDTWEQAIDFAMKDLRGRGNHKIAHKQIIHKNGKYEVIEMIEEEEIIKPFKPLSKRSKFGKINKYGQRPASCVHFNFCGNHCRICQGLDEEMIEQKDCVVYLGQKCEKYKGG